MNKKLKIHEDLQALYGEICELKGRVEDVFPYFTDDIELNEDTLSEMLDYVALIIEFTDDIENQIIESNRRAIEEDDEDGEYF